MSTPSLFVVLIGGLMRPTDAPTENGIGTLRLADGCLAALRRFRDAGYRLVLLIDPAADPGTDVEAFLDALCASQDVPFADRRRCGHVAADGCDCALPGIGLVADVIADPGLDRRRSIVVGQGESIAPLARAMGIHGVDLGGATDWSGIAHEALDQPRRAQGPAGASAPQPEGTVVRANG